MKLDLHRVLFFMLLFPAILAQEASSQSKRTVNWYFGRGAALNFSSCDPVALTDCSIAEVNSTATMSDEAGNLLYYIDNYRVTNKNHELMRNGDGIDFYNWNVSQAIITIPKPGASDKYIAFTIGDDKRAKLLYHEIDMSDGTGSVTVKNKQIFEPDVTMRMSAVNHANGEDVWLMVQGLGVGNFYAFLINKDGVAVEPVVSDFGITDVGIYEYGPMKFSPDGSKLVSADYRDGKYHLLFYHFNNETGQLSDEIVDYYGGATPMGVEFSPNNKFVYLSGRSGSCSPGISYLYQYDVSKWNADSIVSGRKQIHSSSENYSFLQIAINGKIYMGGRTSECDESLYLHVINNPNGIGLDCDFEENAIYLEGEYVWDGLCNFNQSYFNDLLPDLPSETVICADDTATLMPGNFSSFTWSTGETDSEIEIREEGRYWVDVENSVGCLFSDSTSLTVHMLPELNIEDYWVTENEVIEIDPGNFHSYLWSTGSIEPVLTIVSDTLDLGDNLFSVEVQDKYGCFFGNEFIVNVSVPNAMTGEKSIENELILKPTSNSIAVINNSTVFKNHTIIVYSFNGSVCFITKIPANSTIDIPLKSKEHYIVVLKSDTGSLARKIYVN